MKNTTTHNLINLLSYEKGSCDPVNENWFKNYKYKHEVGIKSTETGNDGIIA